MPGAFKAGNGPQRIPPMRRNVCSTLGKRRLAELTPLDLRAVYQDVLDRGLLARSVRNVHAVAREAQLLANPNDAVELPK